MVAVKSRTPKPKFKIPSDFDSEAEFLADMREEFAKDISFDKFNRQAAQEDTQFMVGDQWNDTVRARREAARKPVMTINRLPAFVAQIVGNRRLNETVIKITPDAAEDVSVARVREGLIRNIQKVSRAELAYDKALENQVICGIGNFQAILDYDSDDVFDQSIRVAAINDPMAVVWDRMLQDGTGADARHVFVLDTYARKDFEAQWPWAQASDLEFSSAVMADLRSGGWFIENSVRVVSYWRMRTKKRTLALLNNGKTVDITDEEDPEVLNQVVMREDGSPVMREVNRKYAQMYLCSGTDILEGPYNLEISRVPVFRVPGWEVNTGDRRHRWGLIRFLKDPQRLHNYWRSVIAEKLMLSPRAVWKATDTAVSGREQEWRQSHISDDSLLIWNSESGQEPKRVEPAQLEPALLGQAEITTQDIKDVSNIHEANLGMPSNEVSGAAIMARQRVSDTGTILYHDNLNKAIEQCGVVINELIPVVYDTARVIKVLGEDGQQDAQVINDFDNPNSIDITEGKYNVTVTTGPSYATKRIEAAANMMNLINAMPNVAQIAADKIVEAQDWPGAEEIARRLRMTLPPGIIDPKDMTPQQLQMAQGAQAQQQQTAQMAQAAEMAKLQKDQSQAALNAARARNYATQADLMPAEADTKAVTASSQNADRELRGHLEAIKVATGA